MSSNKDNFADLQAEFLQAVFSNLKKADREIFHKIILLIESSLWTTDSILSAGKEHLLKPAFFAEKTAFGHLNNSKEFEAPEEE